MFCPKCGKENLEDQQLCQFCSWVLSDTSLNVVTDPGAKTSALAIWSLVLGILTPFVCFVTSLPAVVCGIVGLVKISKSQGQLKGKGLAIAGITIPAVFFLLLPILLMMLGIMMPVVVKTRCSSQKMMCASNLSGIGKAMMVYANDSGGKYPTPNWCNLLIDYGEVDESLFRCLGAGEGPCNYAMNVNIVDAGSQAAPSDTVLLFETSPGWNQIGGPEILSTENHQGQGCNVLFCDGHVEFIKAEDVNSLKWRGDKNGF